jgi:hypothetical protein
MLLFEGDCPKRAVKQFEGAGSVRLMWIVTLALREY